MMNGFVRNETGISGLVIPDGRGILAGYHLARATV
jgi:hypothetical protein